MKKSIVAKKNLTKGSKIKHQDIAFKSPGVGLEPYKYTKIIGKTLKKNLFQDDPILLKDLIS